MCQVGGVLHGASHRNDARCERRRPPPQPFCSARARALARAPCTPPAAATALSPSHARSGPPPTCCRLSLIALPSTPPDAGSADGRPGGVSEAGGARERRDAGASRRRGRRSPAGLQRSASRRCQGLGRCLSDVRGLYVSNEAGCGTRKAKLRGGWPEQRWHAGEGRRFGLGDEVVDLVGRGGSGGVMPK